MNGVIFYGFRWVNKMRIFGVFFSNGFVCVEGDNWKLKLDKFSFVFNLWSFREFFFIGRFMIINILGVS